MRERNELFKQKNINLNENNQKYKLYLRKMRLNGLIEKKRLQS